jgi:hypothetical protein
MAILRAIGAVLAGAVCAFVLGAVYEYLPESITPDPARWRYLYPWLLGIAGMASSIVSIVVFYPALSQASARAALRGGQSGRDRVAAKSAAGDVPGMPKFDFDAAKREIAGSSGPGGSSSASRPAGGAPASVSPASPSIPPSAASPPASLGGGSRPGGTAQTPQEGEKH